MNKSTENGAMATEMNNVMTMPKTQTLSLKWKVRLNFFLRAIVAISLIVLAVSLFQRRFAIRETNDKLFLLTDTKSRYIKNCFGHIDQQLRSFSADRQTIDALNQLSGSFLNIENDNYFTATVTSLDRVNAVIEGFYTTEILPSLNDASNSSSNLQTLLPADNKQRILQYLYLASNPRSMGKKSALNKADDGSAYSNLHAQYHPEMLKFARQAGITDIVLVDYRSGYVVYSMMKNLDFATNLYDGPYKNSGLGVAFRNAIGNPAKGEVSYVDASFYVAALMQPQMFISTPVFNGTQLMGAVIFTISLSTLDNMLMIDKEGILSGESLKTIIIGKDFLYRSNDPEFISNQANYLRKLRKYADNGETAARVKRLGTTALTQSVDPLVFTDALKGKANFSQYTTETGKKVFCDFAPLKIENLKWILVTQTNIAEVLDPVHRFILVMIAIALLIATVLYYISGITSNTISYQIISLRNGINSLLKGEKIQEVNDESKDEIGESFIALGKLSKRVIEGATFVTEMGRGNIDLDFPVTGDDDYYGQSMNSLKRSLVLRREEEEKRIREDEIRSWTTHGIALFNDILRTDNNNLEKLALNITRNIIQYLSANQGGLFLMEEEEDTKYLNLVASYAFERRKFIKKRIEIGEGLVGTCVLEKKTILLNNIPDDFMAITSGLGGSKPRCLLIVPLKKDDDVLGVLEIASFNDLKPYEVEFAEKVAESIASALITVRLHIQTTQYLERFQQQTEEMKAQDEELRQNIEELQATHEQMERLKKEENERNEKMIKEMDNYRKLLIAVINEIPEKIFLKDDQGKYVIANKPVADDYKLSVEEILGKSDFDFYPKEEATTYFNHEQEIINSGITESYEEGDPSKSDELVVRSIKKPFFIEHLGVKGLFSAEFDITDIKRKEYEALKLAEEINEKKHEIDIASIELQKEKALLDALLNSVPEHIYFKDKQSRFLRFSHSMIKLFGLEKPEDLVGKSDFDFFSEEHSRPAFEDEQKIIKTGKAIIDLEEKNVLADGTTSWVNTTKMPLKDAKGEIIGTFGISKDITNIKKMQQDAIEKSEQLKAQEEELRQNLEEMQSTQEDLIRQIDENAKIQQALGKEKALMDALMDNVPESIYFKDKQSKFIRFSRSMLKLFGLTKPEELIGKSDFDFFSEEHAKPAYEDEQRIIKTGKAIIDLEEREVLEDGRANWVNTTKMPLLDSEGNIIGTFGISKTITHIKNMQQEALEKNEELKAQEEELRQNLEEMQSTQEDMMRQIEKNAKMQETLSKEKTLMDALMDNIPATIYFKDSKSRFIRISRSLIPKFHVSSADEIYGKSDFDFHGKEHAQESYDDEQRIMKTGKGVMNIVEKEAFEDGRVSWGSTSKMPLRDKNGNIVGTFGITSDITAFKNMEIEAKETKMKLKEAERKLALLEKQVKERRGRGKQ